MQRFAASPAFMDAYNSVSGLGVDFNNLTNLGSESRSQQKRTAMQASSDIVRAQNEAEAMVEAAKVGAQATRSAGQAAGQASMFGGIASGIGTIAGAIPMGGGGGGVGMGSAASTLTNPNIPSTFAPTTPFAFDASSIPASAYSTGGFSL